MICDFNDAAHSTRDISVQYEGCLGGGGKEGGGGGGGVEGGALLILLAQEDELLLGWLPLFSLLLHNSIIIKLVLLLQNKCILSVKPNHTSSTAPHLFIPILPADCVNNLNLGVIVQGDLGQQLVISIVSDKQHLLLGSRKW